MDFSVLMSVYRNDNPLFFKEALASVTIAQELKPNQVVIVFDGPVSEEIETTISHIRKMDESIEYTVIRKPQNAGLAAALNSGLSYCKYEWVARMDADDISISCRFKKQFEYLKEHPEVSVLGGYIVEFEDDFANLKSIRKVGCSYNEIVTMAKSRTPMNHMSVVYNKRAIFNINGYSEDFGKLEDYKLWVDLIAAGEILANISDVLVKVRIGDGFIERRSSKREIEDWDMLQGYLINAGLITKLKALQNRFYIRAFIYMPVWMKKLAYKIVLRKGGDKNEKIQDWIYNRSV